MKAYLFSDGTVDKELLEMDIHDGYVVVDDCDRSWGSLRSDHPGARYFLQVNDHGNMTLYSRWGREVWGIV